MAKEEQPLLLFAKEDLSNIYAPLKTTQRIKYTCFNVSQNFLVFGASSGGLYVFKRDPCTFLQLLPNKEGAVTQLCISPSEKFFAFATVKGTVCILERNVGPGARLVQVSREHRDSDVTALQWNSENSELYIGDNQGRISILNILMLISKNLFNMPTFMLMKLDSPIVQLDWRRNLLLVSTMTRCYVCNTNKEEFWQIGTKLRDGEYGACFFGVNDETVDYESKSMGNRNGKFTSVNIDTILGNDEDESLNEDKIFCSRPGSRVWEADINGTVKSTHELKHALSSTPTRIVNINCEDKTTGRIQLEKSQHSVNFSKLYLLANKYLFTYNRDGMFLFDPLNPSVVFWNAEFSDIIGCKVFQDVVYLRLSTGAMHVLTLMSIEKLLIGLYLRKKYILCADLCFQHLEYLISQIAICPKLHLLIDLEDKLPKDDECNLLPFFEALAKNRKIYNANQRLQSGIFLVGNKFALINGIQLTKQTNTLDEDSMRKKKRSRSLDSSRKHSLGLRKSNSSLTIQESSILLESSYLQENHDMDDCKREENDFLDIELFSSVTSAETIKAFKNLSLTVTDKITTGTKSLKETWQTFEDKVKHLTNDFPQEPLDTKPGMIENKYGNSETREDFIYNTEIVNTKHMQQSSQRYPVLNTSPVIEICDHIVESQLNNEDANNLLFTLFQRIESLCKQYENVCAEKQPQGETQNTSRKKRFPFIHYFTTKYSSIIQECLNRSLVSQIQVKILECKLSSVTINHAMTPEYLFTVHSQRCLDIDHLLSIHLSVFSELIDPATIIDNIRNSGISCYYLSLCAVLDLYEEGALLRVTNTETQSTDRLLPSLLHAMFWVLNMGQPETCLKMGESVPLKEVLYLILRLQLSQVQTGIELKHAILECQKLFLTYLDNTDNYSTIVKALEDQELEQYIITAFECVNAQTSHRSCTCGFPLPSPTMSIPQFPNIGQLMSNHYWENNRNQLYALASKIPMMWQCMTLHETDNQIIDMLPLILHMGDITELADRLACFNRDLWEATLDLFVKLQSGLCLNCSTRHVRSEGMNGITWTSLGLLMVQSLGAKTTLDIMMKFASHIPAGALDRKFYLSCISSSMIAKSVISPGLKSSNVLLEPSRGISGFGTKEASNTSANNVCPCCTLPLTHHSLLPDVRLTSFSCHHTYHTACLPQHITLQCLICINM